MARYSVDKQPSPEWLSSVSRSFLSDERVTFSYQNNELHWHEEEKDGQIFALVWELVKETAHYDDKTFRDQVIPQIKNLINNSPIFNRLNSDQIKVSMAHVGTTPYVHTLEVLLRLDTSPVLDHMHKATLRMSALYHDIGKSLASDIGLDEVEEWPGCERHGCPDHFALSAMMIERMASISGQVDIEELVFIVLHHHLFEVMATLKSMGETRARSIFDTDFDQVENELLTIIDEGVEENGEGRHHLVLLLYLLTRADVASITAYHEVWQGQIWNFFELSKIIWNDLSDALKNTFIQAFFLPKNLAYDPS